MFFVYKKGRKLQHSTGQHSAGRLYFCFQEKLCFKNI